MRSILRIHSTYTFPSHDQKGIPKKTTPRLVLLLLKLWKAGLSFKKKLDYNEGVEERERYLSPGSCCSGVVWRAAPGCWGSACGPGCRRWDAEPQPTGAAQFGGRAKWLSYPGGCEHTQQAWTYLHLWRHGNLMDRKHEAHLASDLLYLYYQMCVCICTLEPNSRARAAVAFDRSASWRAMNQTDWNHAGCKTRWNVFCSPATD